MKTTQEVADWLDARALNARRIAGMKSGKDRDGWIEDAEFLEQAVRLIRAEIGD